MGQTSIPCTASVRDKLADDKPDGVSWSEYLDALHKDAQFIVVNDDVSVQEMATELIDTIGATAGGPAVDDTPSAERVTAELDASERRKIAEEVAEVLQR